MANPRLDTSGRGVRAPRSGYLVILWYCSWNPRRDAPFSYGLPLNLHYLLFGGNSRVLSP